MEDAPEHTNEQVDEAAPMDPREWDVVQSVYGFDRLAKLVKHARKMTPRIVDTATEGHPLDIALDIIGECKQAALLAYGKVMWQDAHDMKTDIGA